MNLTCHRHARFGSVLMAEHFNSEYRFDSNSNQWMEKYLYTKQTPKIKTENIIIFKIPTAVDKAFALWDLDIGVYVYAIKKYSDLEQFC